MRYVRNYKNFVDYKNKPKEQENLFQFEKKYFRLGKNVNIFDVGLIKESNQTEKLLLEKIGSKNLDYIVVESLYTTINDIKKFGSINEENILDKIGKTVKKVISKTANVIYKSAEFIGTGVFKLGKFVFNSISDFVKGAVNLFKKIWNVAVSVFKWFWNLVIKSWKTVGKKILNGFKSVPIAQLNGLASLLYDTSTVSEFKELSEDTKKIFSKKNKVQEGGIPGVDEEETEQEFINRAEEVDSIDSDSDEEGSDEESKEKIKKESHITKSHINYFYQSYKGFVSQHGTFDIEDIYRIVEDKGGEETGDTKKKKTVVGWVAEVLGFLVSGLVKLQEFGIKTVVNSVVSFYSGIARGFTKAFKYIKLGAIAGLVYHLIHGTMAILFPEHGHEGDHGHGKEHAQEHGKEHAEEKGKEKIKTEVKPEIKKEIKPMPDTKVDTSATKQDSISSERGGMMDVLKMKGDAEMKAVNEIKDIAESSFTGLLASLGSGILKKVLTNIFGPAGHTILLVVEIILVTWGIFELSVLMCNSETIKKNAGKFPGYKTVCGIVNTIHHKLDSLQGIKHEAEH